MLEIRYRLVFKSDFHVGSGMGIPGLVDNGLSRDAWGNPVFRVKGVIKDAVKNLLLLRPTERSNEVLQCLFGVEGRPESKPVLKFYRPELGHNLRSLIEGNDYIRENLSTVETHTQLERGTKTAKEKHLYSLELGPRCFSYSGLIGQINECDEEILGESTCYLVAGMRFVTHIGGRRRRGNGLMRFEIESISDGDKEYDWEEIIRELAGAGK